MASAPCLQDLVVQRSFDADAVNALVNEPSIRPFIGGVPGTAVDLSAQVEVDHNVFLLGEYGGFGLIWSSPFSYEVHTFIQPGGRGPWAARAARDGISIMRDEFGAKQLWTRIAEGRGNVVAFTRAAGMKHVDEAYWDIGNGVTRFDIYEWRA